ncbi:MAG TPA: DUF1003 domain-containing protein [Chthonomonadaceae bacterium]|nr:DUF1003 domain-containing protein [Chthonomonadaceae bacterium]
MSQESNAIDPAPRTTESAPAAKMRIAPQVAALICPGCGGANSPDAVFCANPACHKALGEFDYVLEELIAEARWHERLADKATAFIGKPQFLFVHACWLLLWIGINTGMLAIIRVFDAYPFGLLGIILAAEAIFISGFVLISQNRQNTYANKQAELDYEVNVRTYRLIREVDARLETFLERLQRLEAEGPAPGSPRA